MSHGLHADLMASLEGTAAELETCKAQLQEKEAQIHDLNACMYDLQQRLAEATERAARVQRESEEKDSAISELAQLVASREASQVALVDTVQAFINHQLPSLPATPRDGASGGDADVAAKRFEAMVGYWQDRLHAQAEVSSLKLRSLDSKDSEADNKHAGSGEGPQADGAEDGCLSGDAVSACSTSDDEEGDEGVEDAGCVGAQTPRDDGRKQGCAEVVEVSPAMAPLTPL